MYVSSFIAPLIEASRLRHKEILLLEAEHKQLPEFLSLSSIGILLGKDPDSFATFIKNQPVKIEKIDNVTGITREEFKRYRKSVDAWPVKDCLLGNWWPDTEKDIIHNPITERNTLLKIIIGMAIDAYDYKPDQAKNKATGENNSSIKAALERVGISMDADTIRKYLNEAKELL